MVLSSHYYLGSSELRILLWSMSDIKCSHPGRFLPQVNSSEIQHELVLWGWRYQEKHSYSFLLHSKLLILTWILCWLCIELWYVDSNFFDPFLPTYKVQRLTCLGPFRQSKFDSDFFDYFKVFIVKPKPTQQQR